MHILSNFRPVESKNLFDVTALHVSDLTGQADAIRPHPFPP